MHIVIGLVVVAVIAVGAVFITRNDTPTETVETTAPTEMTRPEDSTDATEIAAEPPTDPDDPAVSQINDNTESSATTVSSYADGTYTTQTSYFTPRRTEHEIDITLTVADGVVTDATVLYDGGTAQTPNHTRFDEAYRSEVVGVALDEVALSRTGGASLTSAAFNEAVDTIKQQAS